MASDSDSETAALYGRILTLLPKDELAGGYNEVLCDEISSINRSINDASTAFAKLEEVRDAVTKLSNGSTGGCTESLVQVLDSTMKLHHNLKRKLEIVLAGMATGEKTTAKKKKTENSVDARKKDTGVNETSMQLSAPTAQVLLRFDATPHHNTNGTVKRWASNLGRKNCMDVVLRLTRLSVVERGRQLPAVLPALAELIPKMPSSHTIDTMRYVIVWAYLSSGQEPALQALSSFRDAVLTWVNQIQNRDDELGLRRHYEALAEVIEHHALHVNDDESKGSVRMNYDVYIWYVNAMTPKKRKKHIPEVVSALSEEMSRDIVPAKQSREITRVLKLITNWAKEGPRDPELLQSYDCLVADTNAFADKPTSGRSFKKYAHKLRASLVNWRRQQSKSK